MGRHRADDRRATEELDGAASFDDAPLLDADRDGVGVPTTLAEGDVRPRLVPVTWGRQVSAVASVAAMDRRVDAGISGSEVDLRLVDPLRNSFAPTVDDALSSTTYADQPGEASVGTVPLRYLNRFTSGVVPTVPATCGSRSPSSTPPRTATRSTCRST